MTTYKEITEMALMTMGQDPSVDGRWNDAEIDFAVNSAMRRLYSDIGVPADIHTFNTVVGNDTYSMPNDMLNATSLVLDNETRLARVQLPDIPLDDASGTPYLWASSPTGGAYNDESSVILYPTPDAITPVAMSYDSVAEVSNAGNSGSIVIIEGRYHHCLVMLICAMLSNKMVVGKTDDSRRFMDSYTEEVSVAFAPDLLTYSSRN